jgi:hypothetical protein
VFSGGDVLLSPYMCAANLQQAAARGHVGAALIFFLKRKHDFFKGSLSNLSHLRQVMLQQKSLRILSKQHQAWHEKVQLAV